MTVDTMAVRAARRDTIRRAVNLIDTASPADLAGYLARTRIRDSFRNDPAALRAWLADDMGGDFLFPAWKASQQILEAAGLPH